MDTTKGSDISKEWSKRLVEAVEKPGEFAAAYRCFHEYSINNQLLAAFQLRSRGLPLGPIATYHKWKALGRQVSKGAKALTLCQPVIVKDKEDPMSTHMVFVFKNMWFPLCQTEGPTAPEFKAPAAWDRDRALATLGVRMETFNGVINGNCMGYAKADKTVAVSPLAPFPLKTLFHELAHVALGHVKEGGLTDTDFTPRTLQEVEAECVAMLVCVALDVEAASADHSRAYIQNWLKASGANVIPDKSALRIMGTADKIIKAGRPPVAAYVPKGKAPLAGEGNQGATAYTGC